ncbi:hypothetical protein [Rheinheimera sp. NSM]|uniref:hypothetical protein n=1 Tax=Rheinheimera sp. NSM TaxID=3457884 RepID=UPI0040366503
MKIRNQLLALLTLVFTTFVFVKGTNFLALGYINADAEYKQIYESKFEKGHLTGEELRELKRLEQDYLKNTKNRAERNNKFFGMLFLGMFICFCLSFYFSRADLLEGNSFVILIVFVASAAIASSLWQSAFWAMFFYTGLWLSKFISKPE